MCSKCRCRISIAFLGGVSVGIVLSLFLTVVGGVTGGLLWTRLLKAIVAFLCLMAGLIAIGRDCDKSRPIITETTDLFLIGVGSGASGIQLILT
jgi:hypothetical protein